MKSTYLNVVEFVPPTVKSDSYKGGHPFMFPEAKKMTAYFEFRNAFPDADDDRIVFYGGRFIVEGFIMRRWTKKDIKKAEKFFSTHNAALTPYPFPKDLFTKFVEENDGYFPM